MSDCSCIFCKIIKKNFPCDIIYEDENFIAILDKFPSSMGHALVIPKEHYANIFELPDQLAKEIFLVVKKVAIIMKSVLKLSDMNILQNNGTFAGQTVDHLHIHLIPRYKGDSNKISIKWNTESIDEEKFAQLAKELTEKLK